MSRSSRELDDRWLDEVQFDRIKKKSHGEEVGRNPIKPHLVVNRSQKNFRFVKQKLIISLC